MSLAAARMDGVAPSKRDEFAIGAVIAELEKFSYIEVWVLDPKTLAVLDKQQAFDNQKLAEPGYKMPLDFSQSDAKKYLAGGLVGLIDLSIGAAVMHSEINARRGQVEVGEPKLVDPANAKK
jgi:hypothetical protein